jgi:hypothetical protein
MRYAENWAKVDIEHFELEKVLSWCTENLKGMQFIDGTMIKFEVDEEAAKFKSEYKE